MNKNKTCRNCIHWFTPHKRSEAQQANCRANPPQLVMTGESKFPMTNATTCCGRFEGVADEAFDKPAESPKMNDLVLTTDGPPVMPLPPSAVVIDPTKDSITGSVDAAILAEKSTSGQVFGNSPKPEVPVLPSGDSPAKKSLPPLTINQAKRFMKR